MAEQSNHRSWVEIVSKYNKPNVSKSIWQIVNSLGPYVMMWYLMYRSLEISYWLTLALSLLAVGFLVRIFIIFHDCGHGSFFKSARTNKIVGSILGSLVFTPYDYWHKSHAIHHSTVGNLDKRGHGDVWTLTTDEYQDLSKKQKFVYRLYRHPVMLFGIGPFFLFVLWFRIPRKSMKPSERNSIHITNLILLIIITGMILLMGWKAFLMIQLPVIYLATMGGVWLFYVQHQFENVIWARQEEWDYKRMAMEGSSFLKFPRILQWFSGNIGFHHVHHLGPKIPNYNLERCHKENEMFANIKPITILPGLQTLKFRLWDENAGRLISFRQYRKSLAV